MRADSGDISSVQMCFDYQFSLPNLSTLKAKGNGSGRENNEKLPLTP